MRAQLRNWSEFVKLVYRCTILANPRSYSSNFSRRCDLKILSEECENSSVARDSEEFQEKITLLEIISQDFG